MNWFAILFSAFNIVLVFVIYFYLEKLKTCSCVNQETTMKLKETQTTIIELTVISTLLKIIAFLFEKSFSNTTVKSGYTIFKVVLLIAIIFIDVQFVYRAYYFDKTMQIPCDCADQFGKYAIYFNTIRYMFGLSACMLLFLAFTIHPREIILALQKAFNK